MAIVRTKLQWLLVVLLTVLIVTFPLFASNWVVSQANLIGIAVVAALGLNILSGCTGQISIGHAAFVAVGAYFSAIATATYGISSWIALPLAGLFTGVVGLFFGLPSLRIKGVYLALATIAAHFIIMFIINNWHSMTGGSYGMQTPFATIGGKVLNSDRSYYYVVMGVAAIMVIVAKNIMRGKMGRAFIAIRDNDLAAETMGISLFKYKLLSFFIATFYAGIAGALWAHYLGVVHPEQFTIWDSIWYLGMLIIGGMGSVTGTIFGVIFLKVLGEYVDVFSQIVSATFPAVAEQAFASLAQIIFGLAIILFLIFEPRGLYHRWELFKAYYRLFPFSH
jgi:branched-chain amino acid transport system permease protein